VTFSLKLALTGFGYGILFGFLSPIPGVSTGTIAILLNVYDKIFTNLTWDAIKKHLPMVIAIAIGCGAGLLGVSRVMVFLFENYAMIVSFAFIGLILGCLPVMYIKAFDGKIQIRNSVVFLVALGIMVYLAFFGNDLATNRTIAELGALTSGVYGWLFFTSLLSSMAMLIPGVGGSLMMIAFGIYTVYLESISTFHMSILGLFVASMIIGLGIGAVITKILLERYTRMLYAAISGFIVGSFLIIFPSVSFSWELPVAIVLAVVGFITAFRLSRV
jgi:putative membrane protein